MLDERSLVSRMRRGDQRAFDEFFGTYAPRLSAFAARRRSLDPESDAWLDQLRSTGPAREEAIARVHALLLRAARFEVSRRRATLPHVDGGELAAVSGDHDSHAIEWRDRAGDVVDWRKGRRPPKDVIRKIFGRLDAERREGSQAS